MLMRFIPAIAVLPLAFAVSAAAQSVGTAFTYQGELRNEGSPADGLYDFRFYLWDAPIGGLPVGGVVCLDNVAVVGGRFTVDLSFGSVFDGNARYLEIEVRPDDGSGCGSGGAYTMLAPRQRLAAAPYASFAISAATAASASTAQSAANASLLQNQDGNFYRNAANLTGTLPDARLSSNVTTLSGAQTFSGTKSFSSAPQFTSAGAPFSVSSTSKVPSLNVDLLDGLDSSAFALASHTHDAAAVVSGTLADARLSTNIPRLASANAFSAAQSITTSAQAPLTLSASNTGGSWLNLANSSVGGRSYNLIATGSANGEGAGKLLIRDQTGGAVRMALDSAGRVGLGTASPSSALEVQGTDPQARIRNVNDVGGGYIANSFGSVQLGLFNPSASTWGVVPANGRRSMLGLDNSGRVGTMSNTSDAPTWRNTLDDGTGNATFAGRLDAPTMPAIKSSQTFRDSRDGQTCGLAVCLSNGSSLDLNTVTVTAPADGFFLLMANAAVTIDACLPGASAKFELKIDEVGGPTLVNGFYSGGSFDGSTLSLQWVVPVTSGMTRTYKGAGLTYDGPGCAQTYIHSTSLNVLFVPKSL